MHMQLREKIHFFLFMALASGTVFIGGCGNSSSVDTVVMPMRKPLPVITVATEPKKLKFDQMSLDSAVSKVKDENKLQFYEFSYSDDDGKVYKCRLPIAMAQGEYVAADWILTFNVYKELSVIKQKKTARNANVADIRDFPFVVRKSAVAFSGAPR